MNKLRPFIRSRCKEFISMWDNHVFALKIVQQACPWKIWWEITTSILGAIITVFDLQFFRYIINTLQTGRKESEILLFLAVYILIYSGYYLLIQSVSTWIEPELEYKLEKYVKVLVFNKMVNCDINCFEKSEFYDKYMMVAVNSSQQINGVICNLGSLIYYVMFLLGSGAIACSIDLTTVLFSLLPFAVSVLLKKRKRIEFNVSQMLMPEERKKIYIFKTFYEKKYAKEFRTTNIPTVLVNNLKESVLNIKEIYKVNGKKIATIGFLFDVLSELVSQYLVLLYAAWQTLVNKKMLYGDCLVITTTVNSIYQNVVGLLSIIMDMYSNSLYINTTREFLSADSQSEKKGKSLIAHGDIILKNVSFCYDGESDESLHNINMNIPKGKKVAIVGANGAGKSTLIKLILKLYKPTKGEILLDKTNVEEYDKKSYIDSFSVVLQDFCVFSTTIRENVLMGRKPENEEIVVQNALKQSGLWSRIKSLPDGIDTLLEKEFSDEGIVLSGGEKQKLAISRIYAHESQYIILDEPSSSLDPIAEYELMETLNKACDNKTVIMISHRMTMTVSADYIYYMERGRILEEGTHIELMKKNGAYSRAFLRQAMPYAEEGDIYEQRLE